MRWLTRAAWLLSLAIVAIAIAALVEPRRLVTRSFTLSAPQLDDEVKLALFSDVDFEAEDRPLRRLRDIVRRFQPDLILVAGDFINSEVDLQDPTTVAAAGEFLGSLPAAYRLVVVGEQESRHFEAVKKSWKKDGIDVLRNTTRSVVVRGQRLEIFGGDIETDPIPWGLGDESGKPFVESAHRWLRQELMYRGPRPGRWSDIEITVSFQALEPRSHLEIRFGWRDETPEGDETGWLFERNGYRPGFKLRPRNKDRQSLRGKVESGFVPPAGAWCRARIRLRDDGEETTIRARFWSADQAEPETWTVEATDRSLEGATPGTVGFGGREGGRRYADLRVRDAAGELLLAEAFRDPAGLEASWADNSALAHWLRQPAADRVRLALYHDPDAVIDVAAVGETPPLLLMAGHTHGGQIRIPGLGGLFVTTKLDRRYASGRNVYDGINLYVTAGVATSFVPIRLFNPPEITLITLTPTR